jgi:hypothetical protein
VEGTTEAEWLMGKKGGGGENEKEAEEMLE